jgi:hypothetical protein
LATCDTLTFEVWKMKKYVLFMILLCTTTSGLVAEPIEWDSDDFLGEWNLELLFEVTDAVMGADGPADFTFYDAVGITFFDDRKALIRKPDGGETEVSWSSNDFVLRIAFPWDGAFQYVATYQYVAIEFGTIIVTLYDMFQNPRVGIMRRTAMAG